MLVKWTCIFRLLENEKKNQSIIWFWSENVYVAQKNHELKTIIAYLCDFLLVGCLFIGSNRDYGRYWKSSWMLTFIWIICVSQNWKNKYLKRNNGGKPGVTTEKFIASFILSPFKIWDKLKNQPWSHQCGFKKISHAANFSKSSHRLFSQNLYAKNTN